jgi:hypothetical protein
VTSSEPRKAERRFFAIASLGRNRWYWVVWPSLAELQASDEPLLHVGEGCERAKADAVERALWLAGGDGEWIAAKYARSHYRSHASTRRRADRQRPVNAPGAPVMQEFLYRDTYDAANDRYESRSHRIVRKTAKSVYVDQRSYLASDRAGGWLGGARPTFRLDRQELEREGYAFISVAEHISDADEPVFFVRPRDERLSGYGRQAPECLTTLNLSWPCTANDVKKAYRSLVKGAHPDGGGSHERFLALQDAYEQALRMLG